MGFLDLYRAQGLSVETPREFTAVVLGNLEDREYTPKTLRALLNLVTRFGSHDDLLKAHIPVWANRLLQWEPEDDTFLFIQTHLRGTEFFEHFNKKIENLRRAKENACA